MNCSWKIYVFLESLKFKTLLIKSNNILLLFHKTVLLGNLYVGNVLGKGENSS